MLKLFLCSLENKLGLIIDPPLTLKIRMKIILKEIDKLIPNNKPGKDEQLRDKEKIKQGSA